jgi:hypothetical protein
MYGNICMGTYKWESYRKIIPKTENLQIMTCAFFFHLFWGIGDIFEQAQLHSGFHFVPVDLF